MTLWIKEKLGVVSNTDVTLSVADLKPDPNLDLLNFTSTMLKKVKKILWKQFNIR